MSSGAPKLSSNDHLRLGSTFHSIHAITGLIAPLTSSGIEVVETDTFVLQNFQSPTGTKFYIVALPGTTDLEKTLRTVYELYVDYVLKVCFSHS